MMSDLETELADLLHDSGVQEGTGPWLASRVLTFLRTSGRLAPAVGGGVVREAEHAVFMAGVDSGMASIAVEVAYPIIAAATEARLKQVAPEDRDLAVDAVHEIREAEGDVVSDELIVRLVISALGLKAPDQPFMATRGATR